MTAKAPRAAAIGTVAEGDRLVPSPVFMLSSTRSGSTLLRVLLNSHSAVCAPHEMHLRTVQVSVKQNYGVAAMKHLGLGVEDLEHLLWDRLLHRELLLSGKQIVVDKTPRNAIVWDRLVRAWPDARFIFLLRHPAAIVASAAANRPKMPIEDHVEHIGTLVRKVQEARQALPGLTVRYEDLTHHPVDTTQALCRHLGVRWEASMLDYSESGSHGPFRKGIGDWSEKIRSGQIQPSGPPPADLVAREDIQELARIWDY